MEPLLGEWRVDAVYTPGEYFGALRVPIADLVAHRGGGEIFVSVGPHARSLHIFARNIPVDPSYPRIAFFVDAMRFDVGSNMVAGPDYGVEIDPIAREARLLEVRGASSKPYWQPLTEPPEAPFEMDYDEKTKIAQIELELPIRDLVDIDTHGVPAIGFAVAMEGAGGMLRGSMPENTAAAGSPNWGHELFGMTDRPSYLTLLLKESLGVPLSIMTWNTHRFTEFMRTIAPGGFDDSAVSTSDVGKLIAPFDIVALQEVWSPSQANEIINAANAERARLVSLDPTRYLPPFDVLGPPAHPHDIFGEIADIGSFPDESSDGGLYILSTYPIVRNNDAVFGTCRGDDCYKAKGVQWARIWVGAPNPMNTTCYSSDPELQGNGCREKPNGDQFIDVFNTHLNASSTVVCDDPVVQATLANALAYAPAAAAFFYGLGQAAFYCYRDPVAVQNEQLDTVATFVSQHADTTRPALILGDFNVDGRFGTEPRYATLLSKLGLSVAPGSFNEMTINPAPPTSWDFDIEHADLAVEQAALPATTSATSDERLDYILLKQMTPVGTNPRYTFRRVGTSPSWSPVWSSVSTTLSDHLPVTSSVALWQFFVPDVFHPTWRHDFEFRIVDQDTTGIDDCFLCDQLDVYAKIRGVDVELGNSEHQDTAFETSHCEDDWTTSFEVNSCMHNWSWSGHHDPQTPVNAHRFEFELWDDDDSTPPDHIRTISPGFDPAVGFEWPTGTFRMRDKANLATIPTGWTDFALVNNEPITIRTRSGRANASWRLTIKEEPPF